MKLKRKHIIFEDNGMLDDNPWNRKDSVGKKKSKSDLEGLEIIELYVHSQMIERVYTQWCNEEHNKPCYTEFF